MKNRKECQEEFFGMTEHAAVCEQCRHFPECMRDHLIRDESWINKQMTRLVVKTYKTILEGIARTKGRSINDLPDFSQVCRSVHEIYSAPAPPRKEDIMV